jgi:hypothetical protein
MNKKYFFMGAMVSIGIITAILGGIFLWHQNEYHRVFSQLQPLTSESGSEVVRLEECHLEIKVPNNLSVKKEGLGEANLFTWRIDGNYFACRKDTKLTWLQESIASPGNFSQETTDIRNLKFLSQQARDQLKTVQIWSCCSVIEYRFSVGLDEFRIRVDRMENRENEIHGITALQPYR